MIYFHSCKYKNFMAAGNQWIEIQLDKHPTTLIHGKNGNGKSSILDAISWALYGRGFRNVNKDQLINTINGRDCLVEVTFTIGKYHYRVCRGMKPKIFDIYIDGVLLPHKSGNEEYQDYLENKVLRMNHKSFCAIVVLGSATYVPFMKLKSSHRREIIEDLLDLQVFSTMNSLLREKRDLNKQSLADIRYEMDLLDEKIKLQKEYIESIRTNNQAQISENEVRISGSYFSIDKWTSKISVATEECRRLEEKVSDQTAIQKKQANYLRLEGQLDDRKGKLLAEIEFYQNNEHCPTCKQGIDASFKTSTVTTKQSSVSEVNGAKEKIQEHLVCLSEQLKEISKIQKEISGFQREIISYNSEIKALNRYVEQVTKENDQLRKKFSEDKDEQLKLDNLYEEQKTLSDRREQLLTEKALYDVSSILLKDGGIKSKVIKKYIPKINAAINKYLNSLDLFVQFELDEEFNETIRSRFREEFSYESFSEGEKMRISLAITFAWRAIAKLRNSNNTNLLIFDEIADGSLDQDGKDGFIKLVREISEAGTHVFVISHSEGIIDKFHSSLKFEKKGNFSRIMEN